MSFKTGIEQSFIVVAKEKHVVVQEVYYADGIENQDEAMVMAAIRTGEGNDVTRVNALNAVVKIMQNIPYAYDRFMNIYAPGLVVDRLSDSVNWMQHFKQAVSAEVDKAALEGRDPQDVTQLNFQYKVGDVTHDRYVTAEEIELWATLHKERGEKPFVNLYNSSGATKGFRDQRAAMNDAMIAKAYDKLRSLGADIKEREAKPTTTQRVRLSLGADTIEQQEGSAS